jgi:hypothetical protein
MALTTVVMVRVFLSVCLSVCACVCVCVSAERTCSVVRYLVVDVDSADDMPGARHPYVHPPPFSARAHAP